MIGKLRTFKCTDEIWARAGAAAKKDGRTVSGWLRRLIEKATKKNLDKNVTPLS